MEEIKNNRFCKKVYEESRVFLESNDYTKAFISNTFEQYLMTVTFSLDDLINLMNQIDFTDKILCDINHNSFLEKDDLTNLDWLLYNIENYLIRVSSINDRVLNLINIVFDLGVEESNGKFKKIDKNIKNHDSKIMNVYQKLYEYLKTCINDRDSILHKKSYSAEEAPDLDRLHVFLLTNDLHLKKYDYLEPLKDLYSKEFEKFKNKKVELFQQTNNEIKKILVLFFNELEKEYDYQINNKRVKNI